MWYFSWVLGLGLACSFALHNKMWLEVRADSADDSRIRFDAGNHV